MFGVRKLKQKNKDLQDDVAKLLIRIERLILENETLKIGIKKDKELAGDYLSLSNLLRNELGLTKLTVDFTPMTADSKDPQHYYFGKSEQQMKDFVASCATIYQLPAFKEVIKYLANKQGGYTILGSKNRDEDLICRGELSGIASVVHEFCGLNAQHTSMSKPETFSDKDII